ncbi:LruC domain-containing protein [Shewanella eurypsychrophilus]|uniref:LruC domain-containing protein n=1 Tax=Shewanella eurypsychrophilus TaxID=2593656 RepID=A0ABX6VEC3_9GAMM|nr:MULTISPECIES: LruC domain-containing protein [Shewanella]QFU23597.1 LruC domain-containing protein [Shewanella sp. YLB-09]QPG58821.1 LruC domain-containing protein [Shewanella eurypsychrophilus]
MKPPLRILLACTGILSSFNTIAGEFESCPTQAFIIQTPSSVPISYGVELATGSYVILSSDMNRIKAYNGVGFSYHDNYIYGWDYEGGTLGKTGDDYVIVPLTVTKDADSIAAGNFYVGDVAINENAWYGYRKNKGLFKIPLDDPDNYSMSLVSGSTSNATYKITDFAFHPSDGYIYAVTNGATGSLLQIDPVNGAAINLGVVVTSSGSNFTFGAQFFDPDGMLYLSNNSDGKIYRLNVNDANPSADIFAYGPSSTSNDGARCALAEVPVGDNVDFGDAPDTYGTYMASNGARHSIIDDFYLGSSVDNEANGYPTPLSDDTSDGNDDEDGISLPTGFELGESAIILVTATGSGGYLNAWFDWDNNGVFDSDEQAISGKALAAGSNTVSLDVPTWGKAGQTWARFRFSSLADIGPTGGVGDGEVEDHQVTVTETGVTINYYPSSSSYTSVAYEDLYPDQEDYDMNDVIFHLRLIEYVKNDQVIRVEFEAKLAAMGAAYHNGFAIQLPDVAMDNVKESSIEWSIDGIAQSSSPLESGQTNAVLIFTEDLWDHISLATGCNFVRTEPGCGTSYRTTWKMRIPFETTISQSDMPDFPYDPFIFATPGTDHGLAAKNVVGELPGRKLEIHLKNKAPTDKFSTAYFGSREDRSEPSNGLYFVNENGMSWALEIPTSWQHPLERERLDITYSEFVNFAADKSGNTNPSWYLHSNAALIFQD